MVAMVAFFKPLTHRHLVTPHAWTLTILATVIANAQKGDPVWLLLVGPPSSAKSELLRALGDVPEVYRLSTLPV